jgi:hypothetical protein
MTEAMNRVASLTSAFALLVALLPGAAGAIASPPSNTAAPTVAGTPAEGSALTVSTGTWSGSGTITYSYRWLRCGYAGSPCIAIAGATSATYTLTTADVGATIRAVVSATDTNGANSASTAETAAVTGVAPSGSTTLEDGTISVPVESVVSPHRILVDAVEKPATARSGTALSLKVHVQDTRRYAVGGVSVRAASLPKTRAGTIPAVVTGTDGWATLKVTPAKLKKASVLVLAITASSTPPAAEGSETPAPLLSAERYVRIPLTPAAKSSSS